MLKIRDEVNPHLRVHNTENNLDKPLCNDLLSPLPNYSGWSWVICGASGSGKSTLLTSIMTKGKFKGKRQSYKKVFSKIYIISPTLGGNSMTKDPFSKIAENQKFKDLTIDVLENLEDELKKNREDDLHSIVILDDVGSQLRKSAVVEKKLAQMLQNRRHIFCSFICLLQRWKDAPPSMRSNISHFTTFRPKNVKESLAITDELLPFGSKKNAQVMSHVFDDLSTKFPFLLVDMSLRESNRYLFYSGFNQMIIDDPEQA